MFPKRYTSLADDLRKKHGPHADKVARYFSIGDPLADAVAERFARMPPNQGRRMLETALSRGVEAVPEAPTELRALFAQLEDLPLWLDHDLLDLGGQTHLRCSLAWGIVLGCCCLPLAYRSSAGNKPLTRTKQLLKHAVRRLTETNWFVLDTCEPGNLQRHSEGWKTTVKVRLIHAHMRRLLLQRGTWQQTEWGVPINQVDLAATNLLFSVNVLRHLRRLGFHFNARESEAVMHLWRYSGYLLGVAPELLCATEIEGDRVLTLLLDLAGPPDEDSCQLLKALIDEAMPSLLEKALRPLGTSLTDETQRKRWRTRLANFCYGLSWGLLGPRVADLPYPRTRWRWTAPLLMRTMIAPMELIRRVMPGATQLLVRLGHTTMQKMLRSGVVPRRPDFVPPTQLPSAGGDNGQPH
jgi:hypothetical protein